MISAVLLHPHPDLGGDQHNNVVTALHDRLLEVGIAGYRFDFVSAEPTSARRQTITAIEATAAGDGSVLLAGYSFGAAIAATVTHPAVIGWALIAPALTVVAPTIASDPRPKLVVAGGRDGWFGPNVLAPYTDSWVAATTETIDSADHFFAAPFADTAAGRVADWAVEQSAGR